MKIHIDIKTILAGLFMLLLALPFTSCNDDSDGVPIIYHVRTTDPALKDSAFVKANPGQMLLIEGKNLGSARKIYINDQDVYFNPNYVTSKNIIVTIPAELELTGTNPDLPKEIRLETSGGTVSYSFHVLSPTPMIKRLQVEYPINTGDRMIVQGENFYEVEKIVLEGRDDEGEPTGVDVVIPEYSISSDYEAAAFVLPQGAAEKGEIVMYCAAGKATLPYAVVLSRPIIKSFSSDMPVVGAEFFITGDYYIAVEKVNINGEYDILAEDLRVAESNDTIFLKLPQEPTNSGIITVTAGGGDSKEDEMIFYTKEYVIANFDNVGSLSWAGKPYEGDGVTAPFVTTGKAAGVIETNVSAPNYWFGNVLANIKFNNVLSVDALVSDLVLKYECFITYPLQTISFQVMFGGDWENAPANYVPKSTATGETEIGQWMSCEIPLSMIAVNATSYSDIKAMTAEMGFFAKNGDEKIAIFEFYVDNIRILPKSTNKIP